MLSASSNKYESHQVKHCSFHTFCHCNNIILYLEIYFYLFNLCVGRCVISFFFFFCCVCKWINIEKGTQFFLLGDYLSTCTFSLTSFSFSVFILRSISTFMPNKQIDDEFVIDDETKLLQYHLGFLFLPMLVNKATFA